MARSELKNLDVNSGWIKRIFLRTPALVFWIIKIKPEGILILKTICINPLKKKKKSLTSQRPDAADTRPSAPPAYLDEQG